METEEQIVYQLLEPIRSSDINNDETIGEREIRAYIRSYRADMLSKVYHKGIDLPDNVFQSLGLLTVPSHVDPSYPLSYILEPLPLKPIIHFNHNNGLRVWSYDVVNSMRSVEVPVVDYDYFILQQKHPVYKFKPVINYRQNSLFVYPGVIGADLTFNTTPSIDTTNAFLIDLQGNGGAAIKLDIEAVLLNPDDSVGYDWTTSPYPFPSELLPNLKKEILRTEFNLILQTKSDNVTNMNNDANTGKK